MDTEENKKGDVDATPQAGVRDPKDKAGKLEEHPRKGRERVPNTEDELDDPKENTSAVKKALIQQFGPNYKANTN
jgi:hypothetical protein